MYWSFVMKLYWTLLLEVYNTYIQMYIVLYTVNIFCMRWCPYTSKCVCIHKCVCHQVYICRSFTWFYILWFYDDQRAMVGGQRTMYVYTVYVSQISASALHTLSLSLFLVLYAYTCTIGCGMMDNKYMGVCVCENQCGHIREYNFISRTWTVHHR